MSRLLSNAGKNAISPTVTLATNEATIVISGVLDGESVSIELDIDGTFSKITNGEFFEPVEKTLRLWRGAKVRFTTSNGAGTPSITAMLMQKL